MNARRFALAAGFGLFLAGAYACNKQGQAPEPATSGRPVGAGAWRDGGTSPEALPTTTTKPSADAGASTTNGGASHDGGGADATSGKHDGGSHHGSHDAGAGTSSADAGFDAGTAQDAGPSGSIPPSTNNPFDGGSIGPKRIDSTGGRRLPTPPLPDAGASPL